MSRKLISKLQRGNSLPIMSRPIERGISSNEPINLIKPLPIPLTYQQKEKMDRDERIRNASSIVQAGNVVNETGTRLLQGVQTFGGSIVGDAISAFSPKLANTLQTYTGGLVSTTPQEALDRNRSGWTGRAISTGEALTSQAVGAMMGPAINKGLRLAEPIVKKAGTNLVNTTKSIINPRNIDNLDLTKFQNIIERKPTLKGVNKLRYSNLQNKLNKSEALNSNLATEESFDTREKLYEFRNKLLNKEASKLGVNLNKPIGEGGFGKVYNWKKNPNYVIKIGSLAPGEEHYKELIDASKLYKGNDRVVLPLKVQPFDKNKFVSVMPKAEGISLRNNVNIDWSPSGEPIHTIGRFDGEWIPEGIFPKIPRSEIAKAALTIRNLNKNKIGFDYWGDNTLYNPNTKKLTLLDLNILKDEPWSPNEPGGNPASLLKNKYEDLIEPKVKLKRYGGRLLPRR